MKKLFLIFLLSSLLFSNNEQLHLLDNEQLLAKAENILDKASKGYLAQIRNLKKNEFFWKVENRKRVDLNTSTEDSEEKIKLVEKKIEFLKKEKNFLEKYINEIKVTINNNKFFANEIEKLNLFSLEIRLRIADKSIQQKEINKSIHKQVLIKKKEFLLTKEKELNKKLKTNKENIKKLNLIIEKENKSLIKFKNIDKSVKEMKDKKLKKEKLKEDYLKNNSDILLENIKELEEEKRWIQSTFFLSKKKFDKFYDDSNKTEEKIKKMLLLPKMTILLETKHQNFKEVQKIIENSTSFHKFKIKNLKNLQHTLNLLAQSSTVLKSNIDIFNEHLFKMKVLVEVIDSKKLLITPSLESLITEEKVIKRIDINLSNIIQETKDKLPDIELNLQKSEIFLKEIKIKLENATINNKIYKENKSLEKALKDKTPEKLIEIFNKNKEDLEKNLILLKTNQKTNQKNQNSIEKENDKFKTIKDSFMKLSIEESLEEKKNIKIELYKFIDLKLMEDSQNLITIDDIKRKDIKSISISYEDRVLEKINLIENQNKTQPLCTKSA